VDIPRTPVNRKPRRWLIGGAAFLAVVVTTGALSQLKPAAPAVSRSTVLIDAVKQGEMLRQVRGTGTLEPEQVRWISSVVSGRVERIHVQPGVEVRDDTILLELVNPDVQLQALEPERQLAAEEADLINLEASLVTSKLNQEAEVATAQSEYLEAARQAKANEELARRGLIAGMLLDRSKDVAAELGRRLEIEKERLAVLERTLDSQLRARRMQVQRLETMTDFYNGRVEGMRVRAGTSGVVQELPLEPGQWVVPGTVLARVAEPGRLKAVIRVPESQAREVLPGQAASIDVHNENVDGKVSRVDPAVQNGTVEVEVVLTGELPRGARPDLTVEGTIEIERLENATYVGRPAYGQPESTIGLFKLEKGGHAASRVSVRLGRSSVNYMEIKEGLVPGDEIILSDMSAWDGFERIRLK
jgi:HlyD family secretion protein